MRVYFDYNATTPLSAEVLDAISLAARDQFGNASSVHHFGQQAKAALDDARSAVAALLNADPSEIIFTSGGTESDNFAIRGAAEALEPSGRRHLIASAIEHEAVLNTCKALGRRGSRTTLIPLTASGIVAVDQVEALLTDDTAVVSVMHANNEIGTIQPIAEIAAVAHRRGALVHTDAVQSVGKIPVDVRALGVDLLSLSAHKMNGPKGAGALWVRRGVALEPLAGGGGQEKRMRPGTENTAAIAGFGAAADVARRALAAEGDGRAGGVGALRDRLEAGILRTVPGARALAASVPRLSNTSAVLFDGVSGEALMIALDLEGIAVSVGSACSSGTVSPSPALLALGLSRDESMRVVRFSLGPTNTEAEIAAVLDVLPRTVGRVRAATPDARFRATEDARPRAAEVSA
jgi:cysteine desulfurase